jgi:tetratricopeptide (TPR) repeat protein
VASTHRGASRSGVWERSPDIAPALAAHFEQGRDYPRAILYREHAGRLALQRSANIEAKSHLRAALDMLPKLPDTSERLQLELRLQIGLGTVSAIGEGYGSADAVAASSRAHEICRHSPEAPELLDALFGLCRFFWVRGELARARELGDQMEGIVGRGGESIRTMATHTAHGNVLAMQGDISGAISVLRAGLELARIHWRDEFVQVYGGDLEVMCASTLANTLQVAGFADQASACMQQTARLAEHRHPVAQVGFLYGLAVFHQLRADPVPALTHANALLQGAAGHQLAHYLLFGEIYYGWALGLNGQSDQGISRLRAATDTLRRSGVALWLPPALLMLADLHSRRGEPLDAKDVLTEALDVSARNGRGLFDAELHRLDGELIAQGPPKVFPEAEAAFQRALTIAREQRAKLWEVRAALSLARLWSRRGLERDARALVSGVYETLTEGFDTPDLRDVRGFLTTA